MSNGYNVVTNQWAHLATEWEHKLTTAQANQTTGLTNARVTKWAPEVSFSPLCMLSRRQLTFQFCCSYQPINRFIDSS